MIHWTNDTYLRQTVKLKCGHMTSLHNKNHMTFLHIIIMRLLPAFYSILNQSAKIVCFHSKWSIRIWPNWEKSTGITEVIIKDRRQMNHNYFHCIHHYNKLVTLKFHILVGFSWLFTATFKPINVIIKSVHTPWHIIQCQFGIQSFLTQRRPVVHWYKHRLALHQLEGTIS